MTETTGTSTAPASNRKLVSIQMSEVKTWVAIAVLLAVVILAIFAVQSYRGWSSWEKTGSLTTRTDTLTSILSRDEPALDVISRQLDAGQRSLEQLRQEFDYASVDSMISILSTAASSAGVGLASITVSDAAPDEIDGIRYKIQPIAVTALGSPQGIFSFLALLSEPAPSAAVSSFQLAGLDSAAVAKLSIQFYLSPQPVLDGELEGGAKK